MSFDTLVLPGGGVKGFCLLGALQACLDRGLLGNISKYVGTSVGAIIGYLLAIGYNPIEILIVLHTNKWLEKMQSFNLVAMINGDGVTSFTNIGEALERLTISKIGKFITLGKLKEEFGKTLVCVTYNMTVCTSEYLSYDNYPDLPCLTALRMSCNLPLIFDRFKYMDNYYIDGGIVDNFPILKGEEIGERVLGLNLEIDEKTLRDDPADGIMTYFVRLMQIPIIQSVKYRNSKVTDKCVIIPIDSAGIRNMLEFDIKSKVRLDFFSTGYNSVKRYYKF
jgi:predicted patatin/cPLA2 family phospholipase